MATVLGCPSEALGLGYGHSEAVVSSGHVHGNTAVRAWRRRGQCSNKMAVGDGSPSLGMVPGFMALKKHKLEVDDRI